MRLVPSILSMFLVPALAFGAAQKEPAGGKLPVTNPLGVTARSWNGRLAPIAVTPTRPVNPRWPGRAADPMAIVVTGAQPRTHVSLLRQKQSRQVKIPAKVGDLTDLQALAAGVAEYVEMADFTTEAPNTAQASGHVVTDPKRVAWPNSRVLIRAKTHDGQQYDDVPAVVEGLQDQSETRYDAVGNRVQAFNISGRLLPSARAWIRPGNIYVSEPAHNPEMVKEGQALEREADKEQREYDGLADRMNELAQKQPRPADFQDRYNKMAQRQAELPSLIAQKRQDSADKISRGRKKLVQVVSVGGTPAQTAIRTTNPRLTNEGGDVIHTAHSTSEAVHGFVAQELEALADDDIEMQADFTPNGAALSSSATMRFRVPTASAEPAFVMGGIKYYQVNALSNTQRHDPDPEQ